MTTTYRGPSIPGFLLHGQRVIRVAGGVRYDTTDATHLDCGWSALTTIVGVAEADLEDERQREREEDREDAIAKERAIERVLEGMP